MYVWDINMPSWLVKPSPNEVKWKLKRGSFIDAIQRKFKSGSKDKRGGKSGGSQRASNDIPLAKQQTLSKSSPPSFRGPHCQSFTGEPDAQALPLPEVHLPTVGTVNSGVRIPSMKLHYSSRPYPISSLSSVCNSPQKPLAPDAWEDLATASVSSDSSIDTNDQPESRLFSPQASDFDSGNVTAINSPSRRQRHETHIVGRRLLKDVGKPVNRPSNNDSFRERRPLSAHVTNLQIPSGYGFISAPHTTLTSPSLSPVRARFPCQVNKSGIAVGRSCSDMKLVGCGNCSSPGICHISGCVTVGDGSLWSPQSRCSSECSPILSPRVSSPSCSSQQSCGLTQLHSLDRSNGVKPQSHKLPLPPKVPGRIDTSTSPVSRWKKGRLIGSGTFGHVYLGFNSETGEMCAMKEVTLFSDDLKSKECVQQLGQEITLLSHLRHPNIVRYFGSETVDDKLYIYLEYVSAGSIHKLLQEYGKLGESAIRSFTHQILSGLAYLHAKNTVHRDIKGANILVDPSGRVKLADFGMAKHITGQSGPLSFKGSPYWMAPEVIRNSDGSNLAVDIWSLGCTVIEMATAKPPWSQYEGVAALFKVGNSKELPTIPDHLSEDGKDFIRKCLQRNPLDRPTAAQLLEHPFVRNSAAPDRSLLNSQPSGRFHTVVNTPRYMGIGRSNNVSGLDLGRVAAQLQGPKFKLGFSDVSTAKHQSCPVSPIGSPRLFPKSSQTTCRRNFTGFSTPQTASSSCTASHVGRAPFHGSDCYHFRPTKPPESLYAYGSPLHYNLKPQYFSGVQPRVNQAANPGQNSALEGQCGHGKPGELRSRQPVSADH